MIYNLNIEEYNTYFVSSQGLLSHNAKRCTAAMIKAINDSREKIAGIMINNIDNLKINLQRMVDCGGYWEIKDLDGNLIQIAKKDIFDVDYSKLQNIEDEIRKKFREKLARKGVIEENGVKFDVEGFPVFKSYYDMNLEPVDYFRTRPTHFSRASKNFFEELKRKPELKINLKLEQSEIDMFEKGEVPKRFTWHHHQDTGKMQLVDFDEHSPIYHGGGYSIWGPGN